MRNKTVLLWVVNREHRQGWLRDGDAIGWDIAQARVFRSIEDARLWLTRNDLAGTVVVAVT